MTEPQIELREAQPYLGIRERLTAGVPEFADRVFPELFGWLGQNGIQPAGPPFIRVHELAADGEPLELEVGAPVANGAGEAAAADDRVRAEALPAGRWLTHVHVGPYRSETATDLAGARAELMRWAEEHELSYTIAVEHFRIGPAEEPDFTKWETEFAYLLD
jgi:effector-binding domain-containing protein